MYWVPSIGNIVPHSDSVLVRKQSVAVMFVAIAVFFLPYTEALTLKVGFPLKVYEVIFPLAILLTVWKFRITGSLGFFRAYTFLLIFGLIATMSFFVIVAIPWSISGFDEAGYPAWQYGRIFEGIAKIIYFFFVTACFWVTYHHARRAPRLIILAWIAGAASSAIYLLYLNLSITVGFDPLLMPGIERHQMISIGGLQFIRSGTFEEGNFAAPYFLFSMTIALTYKRYLLVLLFMAAMILTMSTTGLAGLISFWMLWTFVPRSGAKKIQRLVGIFFVLVLTIALPASGYVNYLAEEKFSFQRPGSLVDRLNDVVTGGRIFQDNPIVGVGLAQYGYYFDKYRAWDDLVDTHEGKRIPNNVYIELLSETGITGILAFVAVMFLLLRSCRRTYTVRPMFLAALCSLIMLNAFPTFTFMYLWAFWALLLALAENNVQRGRVHHRLFDN